MRQIAIGGFPFALRLTLELEASAIPLVPADVRKPEEVERLRLALAASSSICGCIAAELDASFQGADSVQTQRASPSGHGGSVLRLSDAGSRRWCRVETLRADGSFLNMIGSRMIARLGTSMGVAIYGATDLLKLDMRSYQGRRPEPATRSYDVVLKSGLAIEGLERAVTRAPELEVVPAQLTTALLTEHGPVPSAAIWALGRTTFNFIDEARR